MRLLKDRHCSSLLQKKEGLVRPSCFDGFASNQNWFSIGFYRLQKPIKQVLVRISHQFIGFIGFIDCSISPRDEGWNME